VKWDGYRCQLIKVGDRVAVLSRNGKEFTGRFSGLWEALRELPGKSAIIDAEIVACREDGAPDFRALHLGNYSDDILGRLVPRPHGAKWR
jgi:bifunctional non-homologous end joining protein LigD